MIRISNTQLFFLIMAFEVGSTTLFALGIGAERDAWIVVMTAALIGLCLAWVYTEIPQYYPNQNFSDILNVAIGKKLAFPLLFLFALYFYSQASHNFFEFGVLIRMTALPLTPLMLILFLFVSVMIYILSLGFEVFARTCEILMPYFLLFLMAIFILALFSGQFDFDALYPTLANGLQPILRELPTAIAFPFGEMVVFLMFWHYVKDQEKIRKTTFLALGLSVFLLLNSLIVMLSILGPKLAANAEVPLIETILAINIAEIITNLDSIAVFIMFIGGFYKTALHFWGFCLAMTWLFNGKKGKWVVVISGLALPLFSAYRFPSFAYQRWMGFEFGIYTILLFSFLSVLILFITFLKNKKFRR